MDRIDQAQEWLIPVLKEELQVKAMPKHNVQAMSHYVKVICQTDLKTVLSKCTPSVKLEALMEETMMILKPVELLHLLDLVLKMPHSVTEEHQDIRLEHLLHQPHSLKKPQTS